MKILHLHGIGSTGGGNTAENLAKAFSGAEVISPELPSMPVDAMMLVNKLCHDNNFDFAVGTSLGGFYTMLVPDCPKFAVNPAMYASTDIATAIGYGEHEFLRPRQDGARTYVIDDEYISQLKVLETSYYQILFENMKKNTYGIFGTQDDLLNNRENFEKLFGKDHIVTGDFGHRIPAKYFKSLVFPLIKEKLGIE